MKPHKHAELIKAWADGAEIEYLQSNALELTWILLTDPSFFNHKNTHFRIKPEQKPDEIDYFYATYDDISYASKTKANLKLTFDGETGELKSAEVLK